MIGIVIVSHSHLLAQGVQEMALQMSQNLVKIEAAGGVDDRTIGTNAERIQQAIENVYSPDGVLILFDLGSALYSTEIAIDNLPPEQRSHIKVSSAHLVEGAIVAAVEASLGRTLEEVNEAAEAVKDMQKLV
ncbi:MAG: PTS-dependent dihydroxyacetone kinase phosphotransferase subunit DhaM [Anaerolineales bacterium]|nr:PTS-dependent dihydroxyacetone kinase phosphotransferase subunit DhaM [Anaerolineales bacterium]